MNVRRSVGLSVTLYSFYFFTVIGLTALLLPKCSADLKYGHYLSNATEIAAFSSLFFFSGASYIEGANITVDCFLLWTKRSKVFLMVSTQNDFIVK